MTDPVVMPPVPRSGPDTIKEHSDVMSNTVVMTDPVVMAPVPWPGPDTIKEHSTVISASPPMTGLVSCQLRSYYTQVGLFSYLYKNNNN